MLANKKKLIERQSIKNEEKKGSYNSAPHQRK